MAPSVPGAGIGADGRITPGSARAVPQPIYWGARIHLGRAEFRSPDPPFDAFCSCLEMGGVDGGDFSLGRSEGYPPRSVEGGDFSTGALVPLPLPQRADGGVF